MRRAKVPIGPLTAASTCALFTALALLALLPSPLAADVVVAGVPLPEDVAIAAPPTTPFDHRRLLGAWVGAWEDAIRHVLIVEDIQPSGEAKVVYAVAENPWAGVAGAWHRHTATVWGDVLKISKTFNATYKLGEPDKLVGIWQRGSSRALAKMTKVDIAALMAAGPHLPWTSTSLELPMLETALSEDGKPVRLEAVLYKPKEGGPFPLFVFNHGSTLSGREPKRFREPWSSFILANLFVEKGWLVAFPQRRGRGRSDGRYDEGFASDRGLGYSCRPLRSLRGAERALSDVEAAIDALRQRPDVDKGPLLIGGQSRGGLLAIGYGGRHPDQVLGVINFVGGWLSETCSTAAIVNKTLFRWGSGYERPTLWLYGKDDPTYSLQHSRENFDAYVQAGGRGSFFDFPVPSSTGGHLLVEWPEHWSSRVDQYLRAIDVPDGPQPPVTSSQP